MATATQTILTNSVFAAMARLHRDGVAITQAVITSIDFYIINTGVTPNTVYSGPTSLTVATVVKDTLQTDDRWDSTNDTVGYNFIYDVPHGTLLAAGTYRWQIKVTDTSGNVWYVKSDQDFTGEAPVT